jgi:hypothetical protein
VDQKFGTLCCEKKINTVLALPIFEEVNNLSPLTQEETRKITIFSTPGTGTGQLYIYTYCTVQWQDSFAIFSITQDKRDEKGGEIERQKERGRGQQFISHRHPEIMT